MIMEHRLVICTGSRLAKSAWNTDQNIGKGLERGNGGAFMVLEV